MTSKDQRGFSLIEVLVASLLLAVALLGIASMSLTSLGQLKRSGEETHAMALGQQRVEFLRNQSYSSPMLNPGSTTEVLAGYFEGYSRVTRIRSGAPMTGVKEITVSITTPTGMRTEVVALRVKP